MQHSNTSEDMDVDQAYQALADAEAERLFAVLRRAGQALACVTGLALGIVCYQVGFHKLRIESARFQLDRLQATHLWQHETFSRTDKGNNAKSKALRSLASVFGDSTFSGFSVVGIDQPSASDAQLRFLSGLKELRTLKLVSDNATDATLASLCALPELRCLRVAGEQFSIHGLLSLRGAPELRELTVNQGAYSPVELAVLEAELPGVTLHQRQPRANFYEEPAAKPGYLLPNLPLADVSL